MNNQARKTKTAAGIVATLAIALMSGCAVNMKVPVKDPQPTGQAFAAPSAAPAAVALSFKDEQAEADRKQLLTGTIPMQLTYQDRPFDPLPWVAEHTVKELLYL